MSGLLILIALVTLFLFGFALLFIRMERSPMYRTTRDSMIRLFERVLDGKASDLEWRTFLSIPVRHDEFLEDVRQRCEFLDDTYGRNIRGYVLTREGREQLSELLDELHRYDHKDF